MNTILKICAVSALAIHASPGQQEEKPVFRDAATHDELVDKYRQVREARAVSDLPVSDRVDPSKENQPRDLIASSDIISFNGLTTLVPKRSILQIPPQYRDRLDNHQPSNRIVNWLEFYSLNRGWITTVEVTRSQAEGNEPLEEALLKQLEKNRNMIVAVYSTGPISMLPLKDAEEKDEITNSEAPVQP